MFRKLCPFSSVDEEVPASVPKNLLHTPTVLGIEMLTTTVSEKGKILFKDKGENCETGTEGQEGSLPPGILSSVTTSVTSSGKKTCITLIITEQTESPRDPFLN